MLCVARATGMHTRVILTCKQEIIGAMFALYCGLFVIFRVPAEYRGGDTGRVWFRCWGNQFSRREFFALRNVFACYDYSSTLLLSLLNYANIYRYLSRLIFLILSFTLLFLYTLFEDSFDLKNLISMKFAKSNQFHFYIYFRIILSKSSFKS